MNILTYVERTLYSRKDIVSLLKICRDIEHGN
jgi:hypothetical protein